MADESADDAAPKPGMLTGKRGWIIIFAAVILEAVFFGTMLLLKDKPKAPVNTREAAFEAPDLANYLRSQIDLKDLLYNVPTAGGSPATLSMGLAIVLAPTQREIDEKVIITDEDWAKFNDAVNKMKPLILDRLNTRIGKMSVDELQTTRGRDQIRDFVKELINTELGKINLQLSNPEKISASRVQEVLFTNFYLQT
jgi:flagellar basal body-associated protein FliL